MTTARNTIANANIAPRVFLSYARDDGETFATELRQRLESEHIPLWQDRVGLEGGRDWWLQIVEALDRVEFMLMVMTPAALKSSTVHKEWRTARQKGVCVYPVKGKPEPDFNNMPHWMRSAHFYDIDHEWQKLVNDLNTRCEQQRVPFMVEELPDKFIERPDEFEALIHLLLDTQQGEPVAITAALRGAGGYGKTTVARAICHDERVQEAFDDGILWVTLGENPDNLIGKVEDLIYILSHERPGFTGLDAATARLAELLADRDILLVIDDVWSAAHLRPFLQGGERCARLVTTRDNGVLPRVTQRIQVDAMRQDQAMQLLYTGLDATLRSTEDTQELHQLAAKLGEWPLLLTLVKCALHERLERGQSLHNAINSLTKMLEKRGLTAFDAQNAHERNQAVTKTLAVSFDLLSADDTMRYKELAIFPEDTDIPLATVQTLWRLDDIDTEDTCERLFRLSLLLRYDLATRTIRLHDVIHSYLQKAVGDELPALHAHLLDAYALTRWVDLPEDEPYLWNHLARHLVAAGRLIELVATVKDLCYLANKTLVSTAYAAEADLMLTEQQVPTDVPLRLLTRNFANMDHLLNCCCTFNEIAAVLYSRLSHLQELLDFLQKFEQDIPRPYLTYWHLLPDLPDPALIRTLSGHRGVVSGCAISPSGDYIVSASWDQTLKVWDTRTGEERRSLRGHTGVVYACAISPAGDFIVSASRDQTLKVWDTLSGEERCTLLGHTNWVTGCAISPSRDFIVSASWDQTLKVWDVHTGKERHTLSGHKGVVSGCAISPSEDFIVSASDDQTLKVWDIQTGKERHTLSGHKDVVSGCAISPSGDFIVSASHDGTLKIWNARTGEEQYTLHGHNDGVSGCAISPSGDFIVSASYDQTLKVWDARTREERRTLRGHTHMIRGCAISRSGDFIVSASWDQTLKVWDAHTEEERRTLHGHTDWVTGCAISSSGDFIVSASWDQTLKVWDAYTGEEQRTLRGHMDRASWCAISPSGDFIVSASHDNTLKVWDTISGEERRTLSGHTDAVNGCAISPSGDFIVSASHDNTLKIWNTHPGEEWRTLSGHTDAVNGCAISPSGDFIVSASHDNTLKVWDTYTGEERHTLHGHTGAVNGCAISSAGNYIVSASYDQTIKVWDAITGEQQRTLSGHTDRVNGCAISPSGDFIASTSYDQSLKVWDVRTGSCLSTLFVNGRLNMCVFHPDREHLVAAGASGVYFLRWVR
jgi:WD40 repeat protein